MAVAGGGPNSLIYLWNGDRFAPFQEIPSSQGVEWCFFALGNRPLLGLVDALEGVSLYLWTGARFDLFEKIEGAGGSALVSFNVTGTTFLALARTEAPPIVYRWNGHGFVEHQILDQVGAYRLHVFKTTQNLYLIQINHLTGSADEPQAENLSPIYRWVYGGFDLVESFPTSGGTDATTFEVDGARYLIVSNALSPELRFRVDTVVYELNE
jgi:hypothetical protein